ncbi:CBS domain-containing protein [Streptomyces sp. TRM43335]|uniref:CBS domain-containing protein n=1 Tax=Streptomyces taklimakanensis TaxID=2569853 RepID=A0A6G2BJ11_9ACTN|nr:CBS domain-containing protein [Streptomyces taklimakanensis]MTE22271.1 CBS domain-containing protein [Streptomyces taklimakanensis]
MRVREHMVSPPEAVTPDTTARQAALRMRSGEIGCLLVVADGELRGIVTDRDLVVRCLAGDASPDTPVSELMTSPVVAVGTAEDVTTAYRAFHDSGVRRLPVLDGRGRVVGVLSVDDLLLDVLRRMGDLLGPVARTVLREPPGP